MTESFVIGVDAGGTKTTAWLAKRHGEVSDPPIAAGHAGPGNVRSVDFDSATTNISAAIRQATESYPGQVDCLCLCAAGAGREVEQRQLTAWAESLQIATRVHVTSDVEAVLAAASGESIGVALIAGTGSLAWGRNRDGVTHRAGGWGHLLGDEGSAYDIAITSLRAAAHMADGRQPETTLLQTLLKQLDLNDSTELIAAIYSGSFSKHRIANLAKCVFASAAAGDSAATMIINNAARDIATLVTTVTERLDLENEFSLAMTGGVLIHQPVFRSKVLQCLNRAADQVVVIEDPVRGAVALARH